ncbi:MAG: phosphodiesterase YaeI [Acidobacteriota bacterium]
MNRREFMKLSSLALGGSVVVPTATYAVAIEPTWLEVRRLAVPIPRLPSGLDRLRVVQISDIHRSTQVGASYVANAIEEALALEPELVLLTGDFITHDPAMFADVAKLLAPLAQVAPAFAVPGNHDYDHWYSWAEPGMPEGGERLGEALARHNVELLRNEARVVSLRNGGGRLELVGLDDFWSAKFEPGAAFSRCSPDDLPRLVMAHNPDSYRSISHERFDLMLSGHTHGGQIQLPLIGVPYTTVQDSRFVAGLATADSHLVYTNRGLGWNRRIRLGVRPEITMIELFAS